MDQVMEKPGVTLYRVLKEMGHERDKEEFTPPTRVYDELNISQALLERQQTPSTESGTQSGRSLVERFV